MPLRVLPPDARLHVQSASSRVHEARRLQRGTVRNYVITVLINYVITVLHNHVITLLSNYVKILLLLLFFHYCAT